MCLFLLWCNLQIQLPKSNSATFQNEWLCVAEQRHAMWPSMLWFTALVSTAAVGVIASGIQIPCPYSGHVWVHTTRHLPRPEYCRQSILKSMHNCCCVVLDQTCSMEWKSLWSWFYVNRCIFREDMHLNNFYHNSTVSDLDLR